MNTKIIIPTNIQPKPTRKQIEDAIVERAIENFKVLHELKFIERQKLGEKLQKATIKEATKSNLHVILYNYGIEIQLKSQSASLQKLYSDYSNFSMPKLDVKELRKRIRATLTPHKSFNRTPEMNEMIDSFISKMQEENA